jgi:hypothetical protein
MKNKINAIIVTSQRGNLDLSLDLSNECFLIFMQLVINIDLFYLSNNSHNAFSGLLLAKHEYNTHSFVISFNVYTKLKRMRHLHEGQSRQFAFV